MQRKSKLLVVGLSRPYDEDKSTSKDISDVEVNKWTNRHKHLTSLYHNINIITCISIYLKQTIRLVYSCLEVAACCELLYETNSSSLIFYPSHINIPSSSNLKLSNISLSQHVGTCTR